MECNDSNQAKQRIQNLKVLLKTISQKFGYDKS